MNVKINYKEVEKPIADVTIILTAEESMLLTSLFGVIIGAGPVKNLTDKIYKALPAQYSTFDKVHSGIIKENETLAMSWGKYGQTKN